MPDSKDSENFDFNEIFEHFGFQEDWVLYELDFSGKRPQVKIYGVPGYKTYSLTIEADDEYSLKNACIPFFYAILFRPGRTTITKNELEKALLRHGVPISLASDLDGAINDAGLINLTSRDTYDFVANVVAIAFNRAKKGVEPLGRPLGRYIDHRRMYASAEAFLRAAYQGRLGPEGDLDQASLRKIDGPLMDALNVEFRGERRAALRQLLPTKTERLDKKLEAALGYIPQGEERRRALTSLARGHKIGKRSPR